MTEENLNELKNSEMNFMGHIEYLHDIKNEIESITREYGGERQKEIEKDLVQLIINAR